MVRRLIRANQPLSATWEGGKRSSICHMRVKPAASKAGAPPSVPTFTL